VGGATTTVNVQSAATGGSFQGGSQSFVLSTPGARQSFCIVTFCYGSPTQFQVLVGNSAGQSINISGVIFAVALY
jgi:hypothetical protein